MSNLTETKTKTLDGYRIAGDRCPPHSVRHYSGGDTILAEYLANGRQLLWRAWTPDGEPLHRVGGAFPSEDAAYRAIARAQESLTE